MKDLAEIRYFGIGGKIRFYKHFFNYSMNVEEAQEILGGGPKVDPGKKK